MPNKSVQKTISDYLDNEYAEFGMYVVEERAIPSLVDGFKPSQRKIIYSAIKTWRSGQEKPIKVGRFSGSAAADSKYHHGSLDDTIVSMAQGFKNSIPLFDAKGQFGSLRTPTASAVRYIEVKLNSNFRSLYKDFELLTKQYEEDEEIEPKFFLPIIPTVLLNGSSGIAVGFASNILNRNASDLIDCCLGILTNKKIKDPLPWWREYNGLVTKLNPTQFQFDGIYKIHGNVVEVTELPPSITYESYEKHLDKLVEIGKIHSYEDHSSQKVHYKIKFTKDQLQKCIEKNELIKLLKLSSTDTENLTCLDEHGHLKVFNSAIELIEYFVAFRLTYYEKRKEYLIKSLGERLMILSNKAKFIKGIIDKKIRINNVPKTEIINQLEGLKFDKIDGDFQYLLNMQIYSLTKEMFDKLMKEIVDVNVELESIKRTNAIDMYKSDLMELKKKVK